MNSRFFVTAVTMLATFALLAADEAAPRTDQEFVTKMAQGGMTEVKAGELAQRKASSRQVKSFGDAMVTDHSKANSELSSLSEKKGWTVPGALDAMHQAKIDKLQASEGAAFDQGYVSMMVKAHEKTADLFRSAAANARDADLKAWAQKTLATIELHQSHAQDLAASLGIAVEQPVKASFQQPSNENGTPATTPDATRQTNRAPNGGTVNDENRTGTTTTTQDATNQTNRAAQQPTTERSQPSRETRTDETGTTQTPGGNQPGTNNKR